MVGSKNWRTKKKEVDRMMRRWKNEKEKIIVGIRIMYWGRWNGDRDEVSKKKDKIGFGDWLITSYKVSEVKGNKKWRFYSNSSRKFHHPVIGYEITAVCLVIQDFGHHLGGANPRFFHSINKIRKRNIFS